MGPNGSGKQSFIDSLVYKIFWRKKIVTLANSFAMYLVCYLLDELSSGLDENKEINLIEF